MCSGSLKKAIFCQGSVTLAKLYIYKKKMPIETNKEPDCMLISN